MNEHVKSKLRSAIKNLKIDHPIFMHFILTITRIMHLEVELNILYSLTLITFLLCCSMLLEFYCCSLIQTFNLMLLVKLLSILTPYKTPLLIYYKTCNFIVPVIHKSTQGNCNFISSISYWTRSNCKPGYKQLRYIDKNSL